MDFRYSLGCLAEDDAEKYGKGLGQGGSAVSLCTRRGPGFLRAARVGYDSGAGDAEGCGALWKAAFFLADASQTSGDSGTVEAAVAWRVRDAEKARENRGRKSGVRSSNAMTALSDGGSGNKLRLGVDLGG